MISCPIYVGCLAPLYRMFYVAHGCERFGSHGLAVWLTNVSGSDHEREPI